MRLSSDKRQAIKTLVEQRIPGAAVYLFGSRTRDDGRGGDIDILVVGERALSLAEKIQIKGALFSRFGEQKVDIVSFRKDANATFKKLALEQALLL